MCVAGDSNKQPRLHPTVTLTGWSL